MNKSARSLIVVLLLVLLVAGCGRTAAPAQPTPVPPTSKPGVPTPVPPTPIPTTPPPPKIVTVSRGANDPHSIDPQRAIDARDATLVANLFPSLIVMDAESNEIEPGMAKSWDISPDGLVYTFHLIEKVPWVRYNPATQAVEEVKDASGQVRYVTANDFAFGFIRALDPTIGSQAAYILAPYIAGGAEFNAGTGPRENVGVKAVDDYTFQVTAPEKVGFALGIYSIINAHPVPEWAIQANGDAWTEPANIETFGPFALKDWVHESNMVFIKNPFWPGAEGIRQAGLDEINFRFIDEAVALREFEAGTLGSTGIPGSEIERVRADAALGPQLKIVPGMCTQAWGFNVTKPPFDNLHIRRALNYAVDRESLINNVLHGGEVPAPFFTPPSVALAPSATGAASNGIRYDPQKATEELALGLADLGLTSVAQLPPITVEFGTAKILSDVAQALQVMWQQTLGIQVQLQQVDNAVYWSKQETDAAQIFRAGWCPDYNDANNYLRDVYRSDSTFNYGRWTNARFDELVDKARTETDLAARLQMYTEAEQILCVDDAGTMVYYYPVAAVLTTPSLRRTFSVNGTEFYWDWDLVP